VLVLKNKKRGFLKNLFSKFTPKSPGGGLYENPWILKPPLGGLGVKSDI
jgi:hypothetical protein